jgi:16S rRNA (guanine527-N7)-methyltransferase
MDRPRDDLMDQRTRLTETLRDAQRLGFFGDAPIETAMSHAESFVTAIGPAPRGARVIDIGAGGGLPGLVVAAALPHTSVVLIDRREKRTDFLRRAVQRLGYDHVTVITGDVDRWSREVIASREPAYDIVTARGFGPPATTLTYARRLVGAAGVIVISEPPSGDRWPADLLDDLGLLGEAVGPVRRFRVAPRP